VIELKPGSALSALFHDCEPERAQAAIDQLRPSNPATGTQPVTGAAWRDVPATYVRGRDDRMPELVSTRFSGPSVERVELPTGHCPNWSRPDLVADVLAGIATRISA
jgi:pimeloyl-ACP methyl ester carboxylesterase